MKRLMGRGVLVGAIAVLTVAVGALAQSISNSESDIAVSPTARAPFAHMVVAPRALGFGLAKKIVTKSIRIRNSGKLDANVTVTPPSQPSPFTVISALGPFSIAHGQVQDVMVQFAPTAAGKVTGMMSIQCSNCNVASDDLINIRLSGNAKGALASPTATPTPGGGVANVLPFSVTAGPFQGVNGGLASITVCATGTSKCTVVNNMLVDTGSTGIRIFGSPLKSLGIVPNTRNASEIGECAFFGSGVTFGAVSTVDLQIAGEPKVTIPIQVIDDQGAFAAAPSDCTNVGPLVSSPAEAGFNGLLGFGQTANDEPNIFNQYYNCSKASCADDQNPSDSEAVLNPVPLFPVDNNGVVISLPSVSDTGAPTINGTVYFGIGTQSNNQPGDSVKVLFEDDDINDDNFLGIGTTLGETTAGAFFDTGSNGFFFNSTITNCAANSIAFGFYCPASTTPESATNQSIGSPTTDVVNFSIANAGNLFNSNNAAFDNDGGTFDGDTTYDGFDWGLPFFFGRTVFLGMEGSSTPLGQGPYTAY